MLIEYITEDGRNILELFRTMCITQDDVYYINGNIVHKDEYERIYTAITMDGPDVIGHEEGK